MPLSSGSNAGLDNCADASRSRNWPIAKRSLTVSIDRPVDPENCRDFEPVDILWLLVSDLIELEVDRDLALADAQLAERVKDQAIGLGLVEFAKRHVEIAGDRDFCFPVTQRFEPRIGELHDLDGVEPRVLI